MSEDAGLETWMCELKKNRGLEERYMLFEEMLAEERRKGYEEGQAECYAEGYAEGFRVGQDLMLALVIAMIEAGEDQEIPRLRDGEFREAMYEKYKIG